MVALAGLVIAATPGTPAQRLSLPAAIPASAGGRAAVVARPPLGRAQPSGLKPYPGRRGAGSSPSPWTPLTNPPPSGTPGTMLLESDGTVLVHDEPDNDVTGGTNLWYKADAGREWQLHQRHVEPDRADAGQLYAAVFRVSGPA